MYYVQGVSSQRGKETDEGLTGALFCGNGAAEWAPCHVDDGDAGRRMWRPAVHSIYRIRAVSAAGQPGKWSSYVEDRGPCSESDAVMEAGGGVDIVSKDIEGGVYVGQSSHGVYTRSVVGN